MPLPATADLYMKDLYILADKGWPADPAIQCPHLAQAVLRGIVPPLPSGEQVGEALRKIIQTVAASEDSEESSLVRAGAELVGAGIRSTSQIEKIIGSEKRHTRKARLLLAGDNLGITTDRRTADNELRILTALLAALRRLLNNEERLRAFQIESGLLAPQMSEQGDPSRKLKRILRLSQRFVDELDIVMSDLGPGRPEKRLSQGLYVTRTQQQTLVEDILTGRRGPATAVLGDAGQGKSSLLWAIHQQLAGDALYSTLLINAAWLTGAGSQAALLVQEDVADAVVETRARGHEPVVLIDTVDLLLHDDSNRLLLLELCDTLVDAGARLLLACRPEESASLPKAQFATINLEPYDAHELREAVGLHVFLFCPDAPPRNLDEKIGVIIQSVSRGLPVREVCINPLMLRLLFELHAPDFPLMELDTAGLYRLYWNRRVKRDPRTELSVDSAGEHQQDLSIVAAQLALVLLSIGQVELESSVLSSHIPGVEVAWPASRPTSRRSIDDDIRMLAQRGVIVRAGTRIRFFHQTIFEYAAAFGLLARDGVDGVTFVEAHIRRHPDDLFRAAVLEQLLILTLETPAIDARVDSTIRSMAGSEVVALQRAALAAIAHRPEYLVQIESFADSASVSSLRRFAQIVPTVSGTRASDVVDALSRIWYKAEPCRATVLEAFERIAAREAAPVVGALRELDCFGYIMGLTKDATPSIRLLCRAIAVSSIADPTWAGQQLLRIFLQTAAKSRKGRELPLYVLMTIEHYWSSVAVPGFVTEIEEAVVQVQSGFDAAALRMRTALGGILAAAWQDQYALDTDDPGVTEPGARSWLALVDEVCTALEVDDYDVRTNARVIAIARRIGVRATASVATDTVGRLLAINSVSAARAMSRTAFPILLAERAPMLADAQNLLLGRLNALRESPAAEGHSDRMWAAIVRESLRNAAVTPPQLARMLTNVAVAQDVALWLSENGLVVLLVQGSVGGHPVARVALSQLQNDPSTVSEVARDLVSRGIPAFVPVDRTLVGVLVDLALLRRSGTPLAEVVLEYAEDLHNELVAEARKLTTLVDRLLAMGGDRQREGASLWRRLDAARILPPAEPTRLTRALSSVIEPAAVGNLLQIAGQAATADRLPIKVADDLLRSRFRVDGQPPRLVRPGRAEVDDVAVVAREAWLRMICRSLPIDRVDVSELLMIASVPPVRSDSYGFFHYLIIRLANSGRAPDAARLIETVAREAVEAGLGPKAELTLANVMRGPMRATFRQADPATRRQLLEVVPRLPKGHGRILVAAAAQECFDAVRPQLAELLTGDLPQGVAEQILNEMEVRRRHGGGALLRLLEPLSGWEQDST